MYLQTVTARLLFTPMSITPLIGIEDARLGLISAVVNFIIMAFILFCLMKGINKLVNLSKPEEKPADPTTKVCPFCQSEISIKATRCPHCTSVLEEKSEEA